jgi:hypothetical protein
LRQVRQREWAGGPNAADGRESGEDSEAASKHRWLAQLGAPQTVFALTPNRMAVAERTLAALYELAMDADAKMAIFRTVDSYVHGATNAEITQLHLMDGQEWSSGHEMRDGPAPQIVWLLNTGRYPTFQRYIREGRRKDEWQWQFETGLDCVLDGIATRMFSASGDAEKSGWSAILDAHEAVGAARLLLAAGRQGHKQGVVGRPLRTSPGGTHGPPAPTVINGASQRTRAGQQNRIRLRTVPE